MPWRKLHWVVAGILLLFSLLNIAGWHMGVEFLVRIRRDWTPQYPISSLLFVLCGVSLVCRILAWNRAGLLSAAAVFAFSAMSAVYNALGLEFGTEGILPAFRNSFSSAFPGRLVASSTLCFLMASAALGLTNLPRLRRTAYPAGLLGSVVSALGGMALLGYIFDVDAAFTWGPLSRMALFSSLTFCLLGLSVAIAAWQSLDESSGEAGIRFMPVCFAVGTAAAALVFWRVLVIRERDQLEKIVAFEVEILENGLRQEMGGRFRILERHGRQWEEEGEDAINDWRRDAKADFTHFHGCQALAWADSGFLLRWTYPEAGNGNWIGWDAGSNAAGTGPRDGAGSGGLRISRSMEIPGIGPGFMAFQPVGAEGGPRGALVAICGFRPLLDQFIPASVREEFAVAVFDGGQMVFPDVSPFPSGMERWSGSGYVDFPGARWEIRIQPRDLLLDRQLSNLPHMVLAGGLFIALSASAALFYGARARRQAAGLRRINRELSRSASNFVSIVERNADGIAIADGTGFVKFANPAAAGLVGRSPYDMIGSRFPFPLEHGTTLEMSAARKEAAGGGVLELTVMETEWEGESASLATLRDVTERVRTREALRQSEARLRRLVDSNFTGVAFLDDEEVVKEANDAFLRLLGYTRDDLTGGKLSMKSLLPEEFREIHEAAAREVRETGKSAPHEKQCLRKDGKRVWVLGAIASLGSGQGTVALVVDVSDRKMAEEALRRNEEQLRQAQKMEAVGRLAGGIAHDFNNLLTAINGYSDILLSGMEATDPRRSGLEEIQKAGERAAVLTRQLLTFSRKQVVVPKVLSANAFVEGLAVLIRDIVGGSIDLHVALDPEAGSFKADPALLQQALLTLAANSREAMSGGGRLTISTSRSTLDEAGQVRENGVGFHLKASPGEYAAVTVDDTGSGMEEETIAHLFEPFFGARRGGKGTGLGLSNVYGIMKRFDGAIRVDSGKGRGTSITLYLPSTSAAAGTEPASAEKTRILLPQAGESILLAEDEESVRKMTAAILEEKGYAVTTAENGRIALEIFLRNPDAFSLLITDIVMPDMGGCELADRIRETRPEFRMVFISGFADDERIQNEVQATGAAFLPKPFSPGALLETVRMTLDPDAYAPRVRS